MKGRLPLAFALVLKGTLLTAAAVAAVSLLNVGAFREFQLSAVARELIREAHLLEAPVLEALGQPEALQALALEVFASARIRVTVIRTNGVVAADSEADPAVMDNHARRPEVAAALSGRAGTSVRKSKTIGESLVYAAVPIVRGGGTIAVLRTSQTVAAVRAELGPLWLRSAVGGLAVFLLATLVFLRTAASITRPIGELTEAALRLRAGELDRRVRVREPAELATLADAFNEMAAELQGRIVTVLRQNALVETIFASIPDGIIAIDPQGAIMDLNDAAAAQLGVARVEARGRSVSAVVRNREILEFIRRARAASGPIEESLTLYGEREQSLRIRAAALGDAAVTGLLVVFHDVTLLRRLETLRRDFAANVSHELRTPITSIKGFIETLQDGAGSDPANATRFLAIIAKEADRLEAIVEDLMSLARLDQAEERGDIDLAEIGVRGVLESAIEACGEAARARGIVVELDCRGEPWVRANAALLERAVVNLVDNAIKYSPEGGQVTVSAARGERGLAITVRDSGCGISAEHLPRIFERFYRVDRARSRDLGGTGLGLAIVKHVAQAHGGAVTVESEVGRGSTFTIHLP